MIWDIMFLAPVDAQLGISPSGTFPNLASGSVEKVRLKWQQDSKAGMAVCILHCYPPGLRSLRDSRGDLGIWGILRILPLRKGAQQMPDAACKQGQTSPYAGLAIIF